MPAAQAQNERNPGLATLINAIPQRWWS